MNAREQAAENYRRFLAERDATAPGTPERLKAEVNLHMGRWPLVSNGFTRSQIADLERPENEQVDEGFERYLAGILKAARGNPNRFPGLSEKSLRFIAKGIWRSRENKLKESSRADTRPS